MEVMLNIGNVSTYPLKSRIHARNVNVVTTFSTLNRDVFPFPSVRYPSFPLVSHHHMAIF